MKDIIVHSVMLVLTVLILVFNFNNVFGNLEASLVATTWVVYTSHRVHGKKIDALQDSINTHNKENHSDD